VISRAVPALLAALAAGCHLVIDPEKVPRPSEVTALTAGEDHTCAVVSRQVFCWGRNDYNQLGVGYGVPGGSTPVLMRQLSAAADAAVAGSNHTCATAGGRVTCWGYNNYGELGDAPGETGPFEVPNSSDGPVAAGQYFTCAIREGFVRCWGGNDKGQLGGPTSGGATPVEVPGVQGAEALAAGGSHACAIVEGGAVTCWGDSRPPSLVLASGATAIAAGLDHACAIAGGGVTCWGGGTPGSVALPSPVTAIAAGGIRTCAIAGGDVWCWSVGGAPVQATTDGSTSIVAVGGDHTCFLSSAGLSCFGDDDHGQLGPDPVVLFQ
jgi:alpha-tubulin suppressor-like RCC1 family protein